MPIYEYQCTACDKEIEVLQKISDDPLQTCPVCGESALKKKISAASSDGGDKPAKPSDSDSKKSA